MATRRTNPCGPLHSCMQVPRMMSGGRNVGVGMAPWTKAGAYDTALSSGTATPGRDAREATGREWLLTAKWEDLICEEHTMQTHSAKLPQ